MNLERLRVEETLSSNWRRPVEYVAIVDHVLSGTLCVGSYFAFFAVPFILEEYSVWTKLLGFLVLYVIGAIFGGGCGSAYLLLETTKLLPNHLDVRVRINDAELWMYFNVFMIVLSTLGAFWKQDVVKQEYYLYYYLCPTICIRLIFMCIVQMYIRHMKTVMVSVRESESDQDSFEGIEMA